MAKFFLFTMFVAAMGVFAGATFVLGQLGAFTTQHECDKQVIAALDGARIFWDNLEPGE